ncbi:MAG: Dyp-type peroxidase [Oscillatoria princeps RMCB-10]|jgi:deferrochelatase/peroxidase EfeB|nr:Dyp-type peroxidase [Oscillatoria princeps RMCB-10]
MLQEGIYHAPGVRPGKFFTILFLRAGRGCSASQVGEAFKTLWEMYQALKRGEVRDLPEHPVPNGDLTVLVGYGPNVFKLPDVRRPLPPDLGTQNQFRSPRPTGGGRLLAASGLSYADDARTNPATEEIAVQFIAETELAVNRAVVETWKVLQDMTDPETGSSPLLLTSFYSGFQRDDERSWIDFHDGISNLKSSEREKAIAIKPSNVPEAQWTEGGTYLAFLRLGVDLTIWRRLNRQEQERMVGRDKLSGCPLASLDSEGEPVAVSGCPFAGTREIREPANEAFREAPAVSLDSPLNKSHIHRANQNKKEDAGSRNSLRIFRQGYEFLEPVDSAPGFRTGLNFVSFQDTPERLFRMLTSEGWLGSTNFGGDSKNQLPGMDRLLSVRAAAVFLVPPAVEGEVFPGASILM